MGAHSLTGVLGHLGVLPLKTVQDFGGWLRFAAAPALFDFTPQAIEHGLAPLLLLFQ